MTLADEILSALPEMMLHLDKGPLAADIASWLAADLPNVRKAMSALETDGRAKIVRRGKGLHLVPTDYPGLICCICRSLYVRGKKSKRVTCSDACKVALSWQNPETAAKRKASIRAERETPAAKKRIADLNEKRWARPGEREKLSEQNRRMWADPYKNAERSVAIQKVRLQPEKRKKSSEDRRKAWQDPEIRERMEEGIRKSKQSPEARAKFSALLRERWATPEGRAKYLAGARKNVEKAIATNIGKKQPKEQVEKRVESARKTREARK